MKFVGLGLALFLIGGALAYWATTANRSDSPEASNEPWLGKNWTTILAESRSVRGKRVLEVDSYHQSFGWTAEITRGVASVLQPAGVEHKIFRLDSKRYPSETAIRRQVAKACMLISTWKPDLLIVSDDNAARYLVAPYYRNRSLPVVFCGVNWHAREYGFPCKNVTGQVEMTHLRETVELLEPFAKGRRLGILAGDAFTERKDVENFQAVLGLQFARIDFVTSFAQWRERFLQQQRDVDMMILGPFAGFRDSIPDAHLRAFILEHTRIPTGTYNADYASLALLGVVKNPTAIGRWTGKQALRILSGTAPSEIPLAFNQDGQLYLNMALAERMKITFNPDWFELAEVLH